jgi:Poxvirus A22 protein
MSNVKVLAFDVGIKNLSFCYMSHETDKTISLINWDNLCVTDANCNKIKLEALVENLLESLIQNFTDEFDADVVLIENQPSLKNGMMKTVSVVIYTYFNMLKVQYGNIKEVRFISAMNKLKCNKVKLIENGSQTSYKDRKQLSIKLATIYVQELFPEKSEWFCKQKKKDDLADSLLYALYHIEHC